MSSGKKNTGLSRRTPVPVKYGPPNPQAVEQLFRRRPAKVNHLPSVTVHTPPKLKIPNINYTTVGSAVSFFYFLTLKIRILA